jgi:predicted nucleic acid-binding protein
MPPYFLDTNILVYSFADDDARKRGIARALVESGNATISSQILSELANVLTRRLGFTPAEARSRIGGIAGRCEVVAVTPTVIGDALRVMERYRYAFFDSQIIATALTAGTPTLYSEDLQDGQKIDGALTIRSPFRHALEQAGAAYRARRARKRHG